MVGIVMPASLSQSARHSDAAEPKADVDNSRPGKRARVGIRLRVALPLLIIGLIIAFLVGLYVGYQPLSFAALKTDPFARAVFFRLRLPRVLMAGLVGASLAMVGAALQALFRYPTADTLSPRQCSAASLGSRWWIAFWYRQTLL